MCIAAPAKIVEIDTESNICAADFGGEMLEEEDKEREKMMKDML